MSKIYESVFAKIVNGCPHHTETGTLICFANQLHLDVWQGSKYASLCCGTTCFWTFHWQNHSAECFWVPFLLTHSSNSSIGRKDQFFQNSISFKFSQEYSQCHRDYTKICHVLFTSKFNESFVQKDHYVQKIDERC